MNNYSVSMNEVIDKVLKHSEKLRNDARHGGFSDGSANRLEDQVRFYKMGMDREVPKEWESYKKEVLKEKDPEYQQYLSLKRKFENEDW